MKASDYAPTILFCLAFGTLLGTILGWKLHGRINQFSVKLQVREFMRLQNNMTRDRAALARKLANKPKRDAA